MDSAWKTKLHVAAAGKDREDLKHNDGVDQPVGCSEFAMRFSKPVDQYAIFGEAIENTIGANDGSVDCSSKNQDANDNDENMETQTQQLRSDKVHRKTAQKVRGVLRADRIRNDHSCKQRDHASRYDGKSAYDVGRDL